MTAESNPYAAPRDAEIAVARTAPGYADMVRLREQCLAQREAELVAEFASRRKSPRRINSCALSGARQRIGLCSISPSRYGLPPRERRCTT
jgi:hypothetical protein